MSASTRTGQSYWVASAGESIPDYPVLQGDLAVDVAVVGGGIVGLTAAKLLARAGRRVALLEARKIGQQVTGRSTAKATSQHGLIYQRLASDFGEEAARTYGVANQAGLAEIERLVREREIDCDFERKAAYVYTRSEAEVARIEREAEVAARLGLPASLVRDAPLPFPTLAAVRFDAQAQLDPMQYCLGLGKAVTSVGGLVFEATRALAIEHGKPCRVATERGVGTARDVIDATHMPLGKEGMFFTKAYPYAHAVLAARIDPEKAPAGMLISAETPSHSVRMAGPRGAAYLIAAGGAYKTGETEQEMAAFEDLQRFVRDAFAAQTIDYRWTNHDYESMDGMPFVGRASSSAEHLYVATGFNAGGITGGTAAAMILADLIMNRANPWAEVFDATRLKPVTSATSFVRENVGAGAQLVGGLLARRQGGSGDLPPGEAAVVDLDGERIAVFKDEQGEVHALSAVCTHLYCTVGWNPVDRTWDCPCHGSRFALDGSVIHGPATAALERKPAVRS